MKKSILSIILIVILLTCFPLNITAACELPLSNYPAGTNYPSGQCWAFAQMVYKKYWGYGFDNNQYSSDNIIKDVPITEAARKATEANLKKYIMQAPIGSCVRISISLDYVKQQSDGDAGHSFIITSRDSNGFTSYDAAGGKVCHNYYTYSYYANQMMINSKAVKYSYIKYIKAGSGAAVNVSWSEDPANEVIGTTSAKLAAKVSLTGANLSNMTEEGIYLYDYSGILLGSYSSKLSVTDTYTTVYCWYEINCGKNRIDYDLVPGTKYQYKIWVVIKGKRYESHMRSFRTSGTHTHKWNKGTITKSPTCTQTGIQTYICTTCGNTKTEAVAKKSHTVGSWTVTKQETCYETGTQVKKCTACSIIIESQVIAKKNHIESEWTVTKQQTCTEIGTKVKKCTVCNSTLKTDSIPATGHNWNSGVLTTPPTESAAGVTTFTCQNCSANKIQTVPFTHTHSYATKLTADKNGHWNACSCGESINFQAHSPGPAATEQSAQLCTVCKYEISPMLSHTHNFTYTYHYDETEHWKECGCGSESERNLHIWDNGIVTKEPTEQNIGEKKFICVVCGNSKTQVIDLASSDDSQASNRVEPNVENSTIDGNSEDANPNVENVGIVENSEDIEQYSDNNSSPITWKTIAIIAMAGVIALPFLLLIWDAIKAILKK